MTALDPDEQAWLDLDTLDEPRHFDWLGADGGCWPATRQPAYRHWPDQITDLMLPEEAT